MKTKKTRNYIFSFLLTLCMVVSILLASALNVFAADGTPVAKVGDVEYADFATAVENWTDGTTLTLLTNVEYGEMITLDSGAERTFDGGEYTLTLTGECNPLNNYDTLNISSGTILANGAMAIRNYGTLSINGGMVSAPQINALAIVNNGSMILDAGNINGSIGIENSGTAELKGGTVTASELYALQNLGTAYLSGANLTTQGEDAALNCEPGSETTISGGTLSGEAKFLIRLNFSKLIIKDTANCDGWTVNNVGIAVIGTDIILPNEYYYMVVEEMGSVAVMEDVIGTITYDAGAPTGKITVTEQNFWEKLINKITFGLFFKDDMVVTVTSSDVDSSVKSVEYYVASEDLIADASLDNAEAVSKLEAAIGDNWKTYDEEIALKNNAKNVIYAKITDYVGNVTYISSDGIELDSIAPELYGIENGGVYYGDKVFKAMDENFLKIEVDGLDITDTTEGDDEFKILADNAQHTVTVTDKAGNVTEYKVTVYKNYTVTFKAEGNDVGTVTVGHGKDANLPAVPHKDGCVGKWDSNGKNITGDTTINAVYTEIPVVKPDEVKPDDKTDLEDTKKQLEDMLDDNSYTQDNKKAIQDAIDDIYNALKVIGNVEALEELIDKLPDTIKKDDEAAIKAADDAYNALTDYEKSLVDEDAKKTLDDAKAALAELKKPADSNSPATGDNSNIFLWIALLFISGGAVITLTVVDRKKRSVVNK